MIRRDCDKGKGLNIEHGLISIGGCENHDKEQFNGTGVEVGLSDLQVGCLSKTSIVARDVIG